jgi:hypothetical protein
MAHKYYDSIPRFQDYGALDGEMVWGFNKLDGQNFSATYTPKTSKFGPYGSRTVLVDETSDQFGETVKWLKNSNYEEILNSIVRNNRGKKGIFNGIDEITFFFEWYGPNSFAGRHQEGDEMHLALIDVFLKKKGYMEPKYYYELFNESGVELPELIYRGPFNKDIIERIQNNDWTSENPEFPNVKEGVVFKRSTMMKGQRRPSVKVKTNWWINKLYSMYSEEECKILE